MKTRVTILILMMACTGASMSYADDLAEMERTVDLATIRANPYTDFIQYAFWPKPEVFAARKCENRLIENDLHEFISTLARVIQDEYLPTPEDIKSVVGIPEYLDGDDCLFLRYTTKNGVRIEVQDGGGIYILMSSPFWRTDQLAQVTTFVRDIAIKTIKFPQNSGVVGNPIVGASTLDIGSSRVGGMTWRLEGEAATSRSDFYSVIMWWSDGTRVLFAISKMSKGEYVRLATMARHPPRAFHRFQYRAAVRSEETTRVALPQKKATPTDEEVNAKACLLNLRMIDAIKEQWKMEEGKTNGAAAVVSEIDNYDKARMPPICPSGGTYLYNPIGVNPQCSYTKTNSDGTVLRHRLPIH